MPTSLIENDNLVIRPVQEEDLEQVLEVYRQCEDFLALGPVPTASPEMVRADLRLSEKEGGCFCVILARPAGELIGVVDFVLSGWEGSPRTAFLALLMIAAPQRSQGRGAEVVGLVEGLIAQNSQIEAIRSGVQVNNPGGIRFWQRMGYRIVSEAEDMPDGTTAYQLLKPIR
jgi:ribosomal protein S18 acetylase RimI-like enzyme